MDAPRNNLDDMIRRHIPNTSPSYSVNDKDESISKAPKFRPFNAQGERGLGDNLRALPSFSTPGFGKRRENSGTRASFLRTTEETSSSIPTSPVQGPSSLKRSSSDLSPPSPRKGSPKVRNKKLKTTGSDKDKENVPFENVHPNPNRSERFDYNGKVKHSVDGIHLHREPGDYLDGVNAAIHPFDFTDSSSGLKEKSLDDLKTLLCNNLDLRVKAMEAVLEYHCNAGTGTKQDLFILQGYNALLDGRVAAIRNVIDSLERDGRDGPALLDCEEHKSKRAALKSPDMRPYKVDDFLESKGDELDRSFVVSAPPDRRIQRRTDFATQSDDDLWASMDDHYYDDVPEKASNVDINLIHEGASQTVPSRLPQTDEESTLYRSEATRVLKSVFNLDGFRPNQLEAITATMDGKDVFVLMPTGGGKSLCYQVPAVCHGGKTDGVTVVVSPLIALMLDQVQHLKNKGVDAVLFNSDQGSDSSRDTRTRLIGSGRKPRLLYVTPEKLHHSSDMRNILGMLHQSRQLARFVIDEAHCVSLWGRDFRDAYQDLSRLRSDYPGIPIIALTATANEQVMRDVIDRLGIQGCVLLSQSFNRPNLFYEVRSKRRNVVADISAFIKNGHIKDTGVIYCLSRKKCEEVARELRDIYGLRARHYHAHMNTDDKTRTQSAWQNEDCEIIVATIAFGMGIDKPNVRYVIHHSLPMSLDGYYQETGRAGRDGKPATCILYYAYGDTNILFKLIKEGEKTSKEEKKRQEDGVRLVVQYCMNTIDCRRFQLLGYFGEAFEEIGCQKLCDNCRQTAGVVEEDMTDVAKDIVKLTQNLLGGGKERITKNYCMSVFRGCNLKDIKEKGHNNLPLYGAGRAISRDKIERLYDHLEWCQVLKQQPLKNMQGWNSMYMQLGSAARDLLHGDLRLQMKFRVEAGKTSKLSARSVPQTVASKERNYFPSTPPAQAETSDEIDGDGIELYLPEDNLNEQEDLNVIQPGNPLKPTRKSTGLSELQSLRSKIAYELHTSDEDILEDEVLRLLSEILPADLSSFKSVLESCYNDGVEAKWQAYGSPFLNLCINLRYRLS